MAEQFITLMADLDDQSQEIMAGWYAKLVAAGFKGTQTPGLPYHITLASFALEKENEVKAEMKRLAGDFAQIPVRISHMEMFPNGQVLFGAPDPDSPELFALREAVRTETVDQFSWTPHATILIDEPEIIQKARPILQDCFHPFAGMITKLHLCAFWPTREIATLELKNRNEFR